MTSKSMRLEELPGDSVIEPTAVTMKSIKELIAEEIAQKEAEQKARKKAIAAAPPAAKMQMPDTKAIKKVASEDSAVAQPPDAQAEVPNPFLNEPPSAEEFDRVREAMVDLAPPEAPTEETETRRGSFLGRFFGQR